MIKTFETLADAKASHAPFAIYWHGDHKGYCSGSFPEISSFVPKVGALPEFTLYGIHKVGGVDIDFAQCPGVVFYAGIDETSALIQINAALAEAERDRQAQSELAAAWDASWVW
jgi:hypothetical protein